ncbi:MAG: sigma factor G inhibitor Gin [Syntrophomonadaceae bacterium]|nr:sigma factor G inhibitor Gin [Syntrophomonadaceae bacterium]
MHGHLLPCCDMCKKTPASGLRGGIKIEKIFLCKECEWKIVAAESNRPDYDNLLKKVKKLWRINLMRQARRRNFIGKD